MESVLIYALLDDLAGWLLLLVAAVSPLLPSVK